MPDETIVSDVQCFASIEVYDPAKEEYESLSEDVLLHLSPKPSSADHRPGLVFQARCCVSAEIVHHSVVHLARPGSGMTIYWLVEQDQGGPRTFRATLASRRQYHLVSDLIDKNIVLGQDLDAAKMGLLCTTRRVRREDSRQSDHTAGSLMVERDEKGDVKIKNKVKFLLRHDERENEWTLDDHLETGDTEKIKRPLFSGCLSRRRTPRHAFHDDVDVAWEQHLRTSSQRKDGNDDHRWEDETPTVYSFNSPSNEICRCSCLKCQKCITKTQEFYNAWESLFLVLYAVLLLLKVLHQMLIWSTNGEDIRSNVLDRTSESIEFD